jgi:flagellar basal body-associated protein FliL
MSEEVKEAPVKKKGKLPVILVLLLVLGGGGFFMMKGKSGPKKGEIKAGEAAPIDKEFLVNLSGGSSYLRSEMALQIRDGFAKESLDAEMPAIRDAINQILRSKTLSQVSAAQTDDLRREICSAVNRILISNMKEEDKKAQQEFEKAAASKPDGDKSELKEHWPSPAGPVLSVYFTSFTTQ